MEGKPFSAPRMSWHFSRLTGDSCAELCIQIEVLKDAKVLYYRSHKRPLSLSSKSLITRSLSCNLQLSCASFQKYVSSFLRYIKVPVFLLWWIRGWWISFTLYMANAVVLVNASLCSYFQLSVCGYDTGIACWAITWSFWCFSNSICSYILRKSIYNTVITRYHSL